MGHFDIVWLLADRGANLTRRDATGRGRVSNLLNYFVHEPSLCLWLRRMRHSEVAVTHVWVVEEDAPYLGSLRVPISYYAGATADLITVLQPHEALTGAPRLFANAAFRRAMPGQLVHK